MKILKYSIVVASIALGASYSAFSQSYGLGASAIYNFKTNGVGLGVRTEFPVERIKLLEGLSIVPEASWFPGFNKVSGFYVGTSVHLGVYKIRKWKFYSLLNASYNGWTNYDESTDPDAKFSNMALEAGIGVTKHKCLRPFLEIRLNTIGFEPNIRVGFMYTMHCNIRGAVPCPKIKIPVPLPL